MKNSLTETAFDYIAGEKTGTFTSGEKKWIKRVLALAETRPDEVTILYYPENNDGHLVAHLPVAWFKLKPPRKVTLTDEQRAQKAENIQKAREKRLKRGETNEKN